MSKAEENVLSPPSAATMLAPGVLGWLDDLLDLARDRGDGPLVRLIAGLMDDLGAAAKG